MIEIKKYSEHTLKAIGASDFLPQEKLEFLCNMSKKLQENFEKRQIWRTETEMRVSVLNDVKFPTKASKYWQAVREQAAFFEQLTLLSFEYRKNLVKIMRLEDAISKTANHFDKLELEISLEEAKFNKYNMETQSLDRVREIELWNKIMEELDDGSFDTKDVNSHQLISYTKQFINDLLLLSENATTPEKVNIHGHIVSSLKLCKKHGILNQVSENLDLEKLKQLKLLDN